MRDLNIKATHRTAESPYTVLQTEDDKYLISLGNQVVSEEEFNNLNDAEFYIESKPWDLIFNSIVYLFDYLDEVKKNVNNDEVTITE